MSHDNTALVIVPVAADGRAIDAGVIYDAVFGALFEVTLGIEAAHEAFKALPNYDNAILLAAELLAYAQEHQT